MLCVIRNAYKIKITHRIGLYQTALFVCTGSLLSKIVTGRQNFYISRPMSIFMALNFIAFIF